LFGGEKQSTKIRNQPRNWFSLFWRLFSIICSLGRIFWSIPLHL
jgi:hypothetical protein